jgi:hypothetical protein
VASLLPKETLALVHVPDFNRSREQWHRTDIYQLWKEPAVQEFLAKPRSKVETEGGIGETVNEIAAIQMNDAFFAVLAIDSSAWKWDGGFRCLGDTEKAARLVESWKSKIFGAGAEIKQETLEYEGRKIVVETAGMVKLATAWAGPWFFFTNDLENLKALVDRADGRVKDPATALSSDGTFLAASKHMPASYAALAFGRVDQLVEKLSPAGEDVAGAPDRLGLIRQIHSFCGATAFDGGRMRDAVFVGMPKVAELGSLARASLPIATKDTFFYVASLFDFRKDMQPGWQTPGFAWLGGLQKVTSALAASGVTLEDWKSAFGAEVGVIGSWATNSQWPALLVATPVKDSAKAHQILATITNSTNTSVQWTHREQDGVQYYASGSGTQLFSFTPTIGLSDRMLIAGADAAVIEPAMKHIDTGSSELSAARNFQNADRAVPTAQQAFVYLDPALLYARFDASLRPLLAMGAAFLPALSETIDVSKLPPPEVITRHLTPIVMSQSYRGEGYVAESIGPVPFYHSVFGAMATGFAATAFYRQQTQGTLPLPLQNLTTPASSPFPSPSPEDSP